MPSINVCVVKDGQGQIVKSLSKHVPRHRARMVQPVRMPRIADSRQDRTSVPVLLASRARTVKPTTMIALRHLVSMADLVSMVSTHILVDVFLGSLDPIVRNTMTRYGMAPNESSVVDSMYPCQDPGPRKRTEETEIVKR